MSTHSPLGSVCDAHGAAPQQSVPLHVFEQPLPGEQNEKPASTQFWSHEPHDVFDVSAASHPSLEFALQSAKPVLHAPTAHWYTLSFKSHAGSAFFGVGQAVHEPAQPLLGRLMSTHTPAQSFVPGPQSDPASLSVALSMAASAARSAGALPRIELHPITQPKGTPTMAASASRNRFTRYLAFRTTFRFVRPRHRA